MGNTSIDMVYSNSVQEEEDIGRVPSTTSNADTGNSSERMNIEESLIGIRMKTLEELYEIYCDHAKAVGFYVRRSTEKKTSDGKLTEKLLVSSCAGKTRRPQEEKERKTVISTRTECKAMVRIKFDKYDEEFEVSHHIIDHNHSLTRSEWSHLHRSQREIPEEKGKAIETMVKTIDSYRYMAEEAGGEINIGHTLKDHLNYVTRYKKQEIEGGDAQRIVDILSQESTTEEDFFFKVRLNEDGKLCSLYWRDSMMKEDYDLYGDVLIFDTTYRTNRYDLICAHFVGMNNHRSNVMFGCTFLADEKIESFEWLFETFKKSMSGKCPITIFTDQDLAISSAIQKVFTTTNHRLCLWHLYQNAISRFGKLKNDDIFKDKFHKCLKGCTDKMEFEQCWDSMVSEFQLTENAWFKRLYLLKDKWCTAFSKDIFSAGILSSQRSESTNNALGYRVRKTTNLTDFYSYWKKMIENWRRTEEHNEFTSSTSIPTSILDSIPIIKHAAQVYTTTNFRLFETEYIEGLSLAYTENYSDGQMKGFSVSNREENGRYQSVYFTPTDHFVSCTCKKMEEAGLLCSHVLRIFNIFYVSKIPDRYISKRWTKMAKSEVWNKRKKANVETDKCFIPWRYEMARKYYNLLTICQTNSEARCMIEEAYKKEHDRVQKLLPRENVEDENAESDRTSSTSQVLDPTRSKTKGRLKRVKGALQRKSRKKSSSEIGEREFGPKTPNQYLI